MDPTQNAQRETPAEAPPTAAPFLLALQQRGSETKTATLRASPVLIRIDSVPFKLEPTGSQTAKGHLRVTNVSQHRIAWRIRSNAPTRYVVNPACGFLTATETIRVNIELLEITKYNPRHKFMAQAMIARDAEKDRRKVWHTDRARNTDEQHLIRITATKPGDSKPPSPGSSASSVSVSTNSESGSVAHSTQTASSDAGSTGSTDLTGKSTAVVAAAVPSGLSDDSVRQKIDESCQRVKTCSADKEKAIAQLAEAINDVKRIEVDLDRTGNQVKVLTARYDEINAQHSVLQKRSAALDDQVRRILQ